MKKIILTLALLVGISIFLNAQIVFSTGQTLQKGAFSIGVNPAWGDKSGGDFALFFHGGYGIGNNADISAKLGYGWGQPYVGIDFEKSFLKGRPSLSVYAGGHYFDDFGLDLGTTVTFKAQNVYISTGLDMDIVFRQDNNDDFEPAILVWLPLQVEFYLKKHLSLIFEADIPLTRSAFPIVGGGISVYF